MTWEETIQYIRTKKEFNDVVFNSYLTDNLVENVNRFKTSEEFEETLNIINRHNTNSSLKLLDVGSGNGISAVSFALHGFHVDALEPDKSDTVGAGAIQKLKEHFVLPSLEIHTTYAENLPFEKETFDVVYVRQAFHHAHNLQQFVNECARVLKPNGVLLGIREHVIYNELDKEWFLHVHPLQKFYLGENAYTLEEYKNSFVNAELVIENIYTYFDSILNYFPFSKQKVEKGRKNIKIITLVNGNFFSRFSFTNKVQRFFLRKFFGVIPDESLIAGRMYSFVVKKA